MIECPVCDAGVSCTREKMSTGTLGYVLYCEKCGYHAPHIHKELPDAVQELLLVRVKVHGLIAKYRKQLVSTSLGE